MQSVGTEIASQASVGPTCLGTQTVSWCSHQLFRKGGGGERREGEGRKRMGGREEGRKDTLYSKNDYTREKIINAFMASPRPAACQGERNVLALGFEKYLCTFVLGHSGVPWMIGIDPALEKNRIYSSDMNGKGTTKYSVCALTLKATGKTLPA